MLKLTLTRHGGHEGRKDKNMLWRYVKIKKLSEAGKEEKIFASYPNPIFNVDGKKTDDRIKKAYNDAQQGKCDLLVWREVDK